MEAHEADSWEETPDFRITLRRGRAPQVIDWCPWLATGGPVSPVFEARARAGVAIADLTVLRDDDGVAVEAIVEFRCGDSRDQRGRLLDWAGHVGYRRVWFTDAIVEVDPIPGGRAQTRCTGCGTHLADGDRSFWDYVRHRGAFPTTCGFCGGDLPQWVADDRAATATRDPDLTRTG